ncbi:MAG: metallophosphoesterase [Candidatus Latescibacteria bacterium]|nr:metallophosphoesterase [Candidatus Latescibacterota bacterium]
MGYLLIMKIAHISDFHLRHHLLGTSTSANRKSREMPDLISQAVAQISDHSPDLVAITGDLIDYPLDALSDPDTIAAGDKDLHLIRDLFAPLTCPVAYLYGNHDHPASFRHIFKDQSLDNDVEGYRILIFLDDEGTQHVPERVGTERTRFQSVLSDSDPRPQIHLQHYLIAPERNEGYPHSYGNASKLKAALQDDPRIKLVLSGHYHKGEDLFAKQHVHFAVARAFCQPPHPYRIYTLANDQITQTEYTMQPEQS